MITSARIRIFLSLFTVVVSLGPSAVSPSPDERQSPQTPEFPTFYEHRWPTEYPSSSSREGCGYVQPTVSAVLGEYRTTDGLHYHGGVDIPRDPGLPVYGVLQDLVLVRLIQGSNVGLKVTWVTGEESYYRYVHVDPDPYLRYDDEIVWNTSATGRYYDPNVGRWKYPVHLPLGYVQDLDQDHLHFEENWWVPSNNWWIRFNPFYFLCPWSDGSNPQIEDIFAYDDFRNRITAGQGTVNQPWMVTGDFDLRLHAHDVLPNRPDNKAGICATIVSVTDPYGFDPLPASPELGQLFLYLPRQDVETLDVASIGILWAYDISASSNSNYYYWPTGTYDEIFGGSDWKIRTAYLTPFTKYKIAVSCADFDWNWADDTVWVMYDNGTCDCPKQGDLAPYPGGNNFIDVNDVLYLIKVAFTNGTDTKDPQCPITRGDANNNGFVDVTDVLYLIKTAFSNGPNPVNPRGYTGVIHHGPGDVLGRTDGQLSHRNCDQSSIRH